MKHVLIALPMRSIFLTLLVLLALNSPALPSERALFLNAFGEAAAAYLNDSFILVGATADSFVADIMSKKMAVEIVTNVQKRIRVIRAKLKAVSQCRIADLDKQLIALLDKSYACMDHQAWALTQYLEEKSPETAKRFEEQRTKCLEQIEEIKRFYSTLPPSVELPEPLSTR